jgi:hypothetical protein
MYARKERAGQSIIGDEKKGTESASNLAGWNYNPMTVALANATPGLAVLYRKHRERNWARSA